MAMRVTSEALAPGEHYKVFLDGVDVSDHCVMANDKRGEVGLVCVNPDTGEPDTEIKQGHVVIYAMHESVFGIAT